MRKSVNNRFLNLPALLALCVIGALLVVIGVRSEAPKTGTTASSKQPIRLIDVGLGPHTYNFRAGREAENRYLGNADAQRALQSGSAQPRAMVGDDFNGDGMGDLVTGYADNGVGIISLRNGNVEAIAPADPAAFAGIQKGKYPVPFVSQAAVYSVPAVPDFLQVGDFNADGYSDVITAARGAQTVYVLPGDGRGNLGAAQRFDVPGALTALAANDSKQSGVFTSLALGVNTKTGPKVLIYNQAGRGLGGQPELYSAPNEVTAFAFGRLDDDMNPDVAAAAGNQLLIIHGRKNGQPAPPDDAGVVADGKYLGTVETETVSFTIRGVAVGDFVWDRNHQREVAMLSDDGGIHLSARGNPDTRPYSAAELKQLRALKRSFTLDQIDLEAFTVASNKMMRANTAAGWAVAQVITTGAAPLVSASGQVLFQRLDASNLPTDDLLIGNTRNNRLQLVRNSVDAAKLEISSAATPVDLSTFSAESAPVAAVSMRLGIAPVIGTVLLQAGQVEPDAAVMAPSQTYNVDSTVDSPDANSAAFFAAPAPGIFNGICADTEAIPKCSLRAAIQESNHQGGNNIIMVPDGTYTLTLGPPDNEAMTGGATEQSGDLDIFDWKAVGFENTALTGVSITGASRDGTILQVGNFSPTQPVNSPNNKERILEVNDVALVPQKKINVTLTNLTFQNGQSPTGNGTFLDGGAIWYDGADAQALTNVGLLTLHTVKVQNNTANGGGGGVDARFGSLRIESTSVALNSIIRANTASNKVAGGVRYTGGNTIETQYFSINNSTIGGAAPADGNQATSAGFGGGGGIDSAAGGTGGTFSGFDIANGTVIQNNVSGLTTGSNGGGGIEISNGPVFSFANSTISNNFAKNNGGGLMCNAVQLSPANTPASVTLSGMTITGNTADSDNTAVGNGGGIYNLVGLMVIQNGTNPSHIDSNAAINGGGIFSTWVGIAATPAASLTMTNGTIGQSGAGNTAENNGGGIGIDVNNPGAPTTNGTINLNTVTITANTANSDNSGGGDGGGIHVNTGNLNSLNGCTIDSNVSNAGTGDGITLAGGSITGAGTINVNGADSILISGGTFTSTSGTLNLTGNFTRNGGTFTHNSGTFVFNGTGAQSLGGTASSTFNNVTVNKASGTLTLGINTPVAGNLSLNQGTLDLSTFTMNRTAAGGTLTVSNGTLLKIGGTNTLPSNFNTHSIGATSTIEYSGTNQNVAALNSAQNYGHLTTSTATTGTKTLAGAIGIAGNLTIGANTTLDASASNFAITALGNWTNNGTFNPRSGTVTFDAASGTQTLVGSTNFFNLTLDNGGATTDFGSSTATIASNLVTSAGTMSGGTSTFIFTGNPGSYSGAQAKNFNNLQINVGANISNASGGDTNIANDYTNNGTFNQAATLTTTFFTGADGLHSLLGNGTTTFGRFIINSSNTVDAGSHAFNVTGNAFTADGTFTGNNGTVAFTGNNNTQTIGGAGTRNFKNLTINHTGTGGVALGADSAATGVLTLTSDLTATGFVLNQTGGTSAGLADVVGTVRRTDLGVTERSFGNVNNSITIGAVGTPPTQMDFNLVKSAPGTFPVGPSVVPRDYTLTPTGGGGFSATLKLRYLDPADLAGVTEAQLILWKNVGGTTWTPQGGTVDLANNFVSLTGVTGFSEWAIAEGTDLTVSKANNVAGAAVVGQQWTWTVTVSNVGGAPAAFTAGQTILTDNLPNSANINYGTLVVSDPNITCAIDGSKDLTCTAGASGATIAGGGSFTVQIPSTGTAAGTYQNARAGGATTVDPANVILEFNEANNTATNDTVTVSAASTTTSITNAGALATASVTGQPVTVTWSVTVNPPGSLGVPMTGNVTVTAGADSCNAPVGNGQCDITFTTAGAKSINATYAGDANYNTSTTGAGTPHTVNAANTTTTITSDNPDPSDVGQNVTVIYTVTADAPGGGTPTGTVTVTVSGGAETCNSSVAVGQCTLALTVQGPRTITASYGGDGGNYNISSDTESHSVCQNNITVTSTADNGAGTLRQALADICDGGTIDFNLGAGPHSIPLATELAVAKNVTIINTVSAGNGPLTVSGGGAVRVFNINSGTAVNIAGLTISGGSNVGNGGGILVDHGTLTLTNVTVSGNTGGAGGGVYVDGGTTGGASLTVINSTISGNTSTVTGGGIYVNGLSGGAATLVITNSTVSGNNANVNGGGLAATVGTTSTLTNVTVTDNRADNDNNGTGGAGGIASFGTMTLKNTILAGNFNEDGVVDASDDANGSTFDPASSYNLIGNGDGTTGITNAVNNNQVGTGASPIDPQLGPLANNGGPTQTHRLISSSVALDVGNNAYVTAPPFLNTVPITDQRGTGFPRIASSTVDLGAYELQPPAAQNDTYAPVEDTPFSVNAAGGVLSNDTPANGGGLTASLVSGPTNALSFNLNSDGSFNYTPAANFNGADQFTYKATEANGGSANATVTLNVSAVNDVPSFTKGADQTVNEDAGAQSVPGWATNISRGGGADENGQTVNFIVSNNNNALFSVQPAVSDTGTLTYTPAANAFGTATVDVQIHDNGGGTDTSAVQQFTITVNAVADTPSVSNTTTLEDTQSNTNLVITRNASDGPEVTHFKITNIQNGTLFKHDGTTQINNGDFILVADAANVGGFGLKFTPAADFNSNTGSGSFDIQASTSNANAGLGGGVVTATITITPVNDTPSFTKGPDQNVNANSGLHTVPGWATNIMRGPATATDETGQTVNFIVSNNNNVLFSVQPAVDSTGTLTFTVAAGQAGQATVSVQIHDNGGGADTSAVQQFIITVTSVDLTPTKSHVGTFKQGDTGKTYTISVKNIGQDPSAGLVTLADSLPAGLIARSLTGGGWTCDPIPGGGTSGPATLNCTRSDSLAGSGATYPDITLTVDVACNAPANVTNTATVSGGNDASPGNNTSNDATTVNPDNVPPVIVCPGGISKYTDSGQNSAVVNISPAVATDNCGQVTVTGTRSDGKPLNAPFPVGITIITWTAKDGANNTATCMQSVTVMVPSSPHRIPTEPEEALLTVTDLLMTVLSAVW